MNAPRGNRFVGWWNERFDAIRREEATYVYMLALFLYVFFLSDQVYHRLGDPGDFIVTCLFLVVGVVSILAYAYKPRNSRNEPRSTQ